jgi:HK97 gp10 family phage protein
MDLESFAKVMAQASLDIARSKTTAVEKAAKLIEEAAKSAIGTYRFGWAKLGPAAVKKHGDTPLLDTGKLQASIESTIGDGEAWVGTNDPVGKYQEFGTSRGIPPRPFIGGAVVEQEKAIEAELVKIVDGVFKKPEGSIE